MRFMTTLFYGLALALLVLAFLKALTTKPGDQSPAYTERSLSRARTVLLVLILIGCMGLAACGGGRDADEQMERIHPPPPPCDINREICR